MGPRASATRKKKEVLSVTELEGLKAEKRDLENTLADAEGFGIGTAGEQVDKAKIKAEIAHYEREIHEGSPGRIAGKTKDSLYREEKELEEQFKKGMPTKYEMDHPGKCPGAVRKHMYWLNENEKSGYVNRYRQIQRILRPGEEKSIETLRKDK
jgi:hypothetical protein